MVEVVRVSKRYGPTQALEDVSLAVASGSVHGLVGRNGAGKSTLVSVITGQTEPDSGLVKFREMTERREGEPKESPGLEGRRRRGSWWRGRGLTREDGPSSRVRYAVVYQKGTLVPDLSVADNLLLRGAVGAGGPGRGIRWRRVNAEAETLLREWVPGVRARTSVADLPINVRQAIELAGALSLGAPLLILDEPTAALGGRRERDQLFERVRMARDVLDVGVLFISHYLEEVFALCDVVSVLRDGRLVRTERVEGLSEQDVVQFMVGEASEPGRRGTRVVGGPAALVGGGPKQGARVAPVSGRVMGSGLGRDDAAGEEIGHSVIEIRDLVPLGFRAEVAGLSARLKRGERLGLVSGVGGGAIAMAEAIVGARARAKGEVKVIGRVLPAGNPRAALEAGVGSVPPERQSQGIVPTLPLFMNASLQGVVKGTLGRWLAREGELRAAEAWCDAVGVVRGDLRLDMDSLSGGNQQKVMVARALASRPNVLVLANPSVGVDVASRRDIYAVLDDLSQMGIAIVVATEDEFEDALVCGQVIAIKDGGVEKVFRERPDISELLAAVEGLVSDRASAVCRGAEEGRPGDVA